MKTLKLALLALLSTIVVVVCLPASAVALPEVLPIKTGGSPWTGSAVGTNLIAETVKKETVSCESSPASGVAETPTSGSLHITFKGCKEPALKLSCNGVGDAKEIILALGKYNIVFDSLSPLSVGILDTIEPIKFECSALAKFEKKGTLICAILEPLVSKTTHSGHCIQKEGKQELKTYWNDEGKEVHTQLLLSKNGGTFEEIALLGLGEVTLEEAVTIMND